MAPPKGNKFWTLRKRSGAKPKYETAEALEQVCEEYFDWVKDNPIKVKRTSVYQGKAFTYEEELPRAMLLTQLCRFIGVSMETWNQWRKTRNDLSEVMSWAESGIFEQKLQGAAVDIFNGNIIAQELGLKTKTEAEHAINRLPTHDELILSLHGSQNIRYDEENNEYRTDLRRYKKPADE